VFDSKLDRWLLPLLLIGGGVLYWRLRPLLVPKQPNRDGGAA
jgi:hypothetical protein